jgi:branched-chain amino acid transport system substrate-binding protein
LSCDFDIVYDKSYPLGTQDYAPVIKAAKSTSPDAFVAWSYPPDTFGLAEQAKIEGLNVKTATASSAGPRRPMVVTAAQ